MKLSCVYFTGRGIMWVSITKKFKYVADFRVNLFHVIITMVGVAEWCIMGWTMKMWKKQHYCYCVPKSNGCTKQKSYAPTFKIHKNTLLLTFLFLLTFAPINIFCIVTIILLFNCLEPFIASQVKLTSNLDYFHGR